MEMSGRLQTLVALKAPWYPLNRVLVVPRRWSVRFVKEINLHTPSGNQTTIPRFDILLTVHLNIFILILTNLMH